MTANTLEEYFAVEKIKEAIALNSPCLPAQAIRLARGLHPDIARKVEVALFGAPANPAIHSASRFFHRLKRSSSSDKWPYSYEYGWVETLIFSQTTPESAKDVASRIAVSMSHQNGSSRLVLDEYHDGGLHCYWSPVGDNPQQILERLAAYAIQAAHNAGLYKARIDPTGLIFIEDNAKEKEAGEEEREVTKREIPVSVLLPHHQFQLAL